MGFIVSAIFAVAAAVATVVAAVVVTIGAVIGMVAVTIGNLIGAVIGNITNLLAQGVGSIKSALAKPLANIYNGIVDAVQAIQMEIEYHSLTTFKPIVDGMLAIKDFVITTYKWVEAALAPIQGLIDVVNVISAVGLIKRLLEGQADLADAIQAVYKTAGESTAFAMLEMYNTIIDVSILTTKMVRDNYTALATSIVFVEEKIAEERVLALATLQATIDDDVSMVANALSSEITMTDTKITMVALKVNNVSHFQDMLLSALA